MKLTDAINAAQKLQRDKLLNGVWCDIETETKTNYLTTKKEVIMITVHGQRMEPVVFGVTDD